MSLTIEAGGLHPATQLSLTALQWLQAEHDFANILDIGCGGGILSLLAAKLWDAQVLAVDIAQTAVNDARAAIAAQGLESRVSAHRSDGFRLSEIAGQAPFDLILINLLAEPIIQWAPLVKSHLTHGGFVFLGGILGWQVTPVREAYEALGFDIQQEITLTPWHGLIACHKSDI